MFIYRASLVSLCVLWSDAVVSGSTHYWSDCAHLTVGGSVALHQNPLSVWKQAWFMSFLSHILWFG